MFLGPDRQYSQALHLTASHWEFFMSASTETVVSKILTEDVRTLAEARTELFRATGRRPDKTTMYRWCLRGVAGTKLEHVRLGNVILTSSQAITRFIEARSAR
jgi:hypothetical protein